MERKKTPKMNKVGIRFHESNYESRSIVMWNTINRHADQSSYASQCIWNNNKCSVYWTFFCRMPRVSSATCRASAVHCSPLTGFFFFVSSSLFLSSYFTLLLCHCFSLLILIQVASCFDERHENTLSKGDPANLFHQSIGSRFSFTLSDVIFSQVSPLETTVTLCLIHLNLPLSLFFCLSQWIAKDFSSSCKERWTCLVSSPLLERATSTAPWAI